MEEFRKGWRVLAGSFIGIATGVSSLYFYSLGLFLKPVAETFGWSRGEASLGPLVGTLCAAAMAAPTGRILDKVGPARLAVVSLLLFAAGLAAMGIFTGGLASFLVLTGLMSLSTVGSTPIPYSRRIVGIFERHRGLALAVALTATGAGAALVPALLLPFVAAHGWRTGYIALAAVALIAAAPVGLLLRDEHDRPKRGHLREASGVYADPTFRLLGAMFGLAAIAVLGAVVHFVPMLTDAGLSPRRAGAIAGSIGIALIVGRIMTGLLLDRFNPALVTAGLMIVSATGVAMLGLDGAKLAIPGAAGLGLMIGAEVDLIAFLVARSFSRDDYGAAYGGIYALFLLGGAIGPPLIGFLFDRSGGYASPMFAASGLLVAAALLALRFKTRLGASRDRSGNGA